MSRRQAKLQAQLPEFMRRYKRKRPMRGEPNDRQYSRRLERVVKRLDPLILDYLLREEADRPLDGGS